MAKQEVRLYKPKDKKKGRAKKSDSKIKTSKRYNKQYRGQGR